MVFVMLIGLVYCIYVTVDAVFLLLNDYVDDYYVWVILIFFIPLYGAQVFLFTNLLSDSKVARTNASWGVLAILCVMIWYLLWGLIYFTKLYPEEEYYRGHGDKSPDNYEPEPKRVFLFHYILLGLIWICFFIYFFL